MSSLIAIGLFCITNTIFHGVSSNILNILINHHSIIDKKLEYIKNENIKKTEALLSVINLNSNLFSDLRLLTREIKEIRENILDIKDYICDINDNISVFKDEEKLRVFNFVENISDNNISPKSTTSTKTNESNETIDSNESTQNYGVISL